MDDTIHLQLLCAMAALGAVFGAAAAHTKFCTVGRLSDCLNFADTRRLWARVLAMAVAMLGGAPLLDLALLDQS